ncbi:ABC transporter ATP-binding protein [soil metagenome]|nr:ABC transporter ATP-binding protein [Gemmatimonadota bacterium]
MSTYLRILRYLRPHLGLFAVAVVAMTFFAALDAFSFTLLIPFLDVLFAAGQEGGAAVPAFAGGDTAIHRMLNWMVGDMVAERSSMAALRNVVLVMFVVFLLKNIAAYVQQYTIAVIEGRVTRDLRDQIYGHILRLGFPFFQRTRAGQVISRVTMDVDGIRQLVTANLAKAISSVLQVAFYLAFLLVFSWKLTLVALVFLPPMLGLWARLRKRLYVGVHRVLDAVGDLSSHIQETIGGIRLVKASGAEEWEDRRFRSLTQGHYIAVVRNEKWRQFFPPATEMITATAVLAILWYGSYLVLEEATLAASAFLTFLALSMKLMSPVKWLGHFPATVQPGLAAAERAFELLDVKPEVLERTGALPVPGFHEAIRFEGVGFEYGAGEPVLREVDLEIRPGEVVALVGPSGAGKSTLADLLPRFHDVTGGRITLDGTDLRDLRLTELRALFGIVTQETILFHDTVQANIAYGIDDATPEAVVAAARAANAHGFIQEMPRGYATVLGERGVRLSGGQRQRIAIARALLRNPPILILDEATSALDSESERQVQQAVDELLESRTVVVIAHRLSTVRRADQILVIDAGRIIERGTHDELLAHDGLYRRLYQLQFAAEDPAALLPAR